MNETEKTFTCSITVPQTAKVNIVPPYPQKELKGESYLRIFSKALLSMAKDKNLTEESRRVLLAILGSLQYENCFTLPVSQLAEKIDMKQPNAARAVKKLVELGYLQPLERKEQRTVVYMLNPNVAFKTKAYKLKGLKELWAQINLLRHL